MPDPQRDIAPIIEPTVPPMPAAGPDHTLPIILALGGLFLMLVLIWYWRRRAPLRALRKLSHASDPIAGADALAALVATGHLTPPAFWQEELELLRFGPRADDAEAVLARLCQGAESMLRMR